MNRATPYQDPKVYEYRIIKQTVACKVEWFLNRHTHEMLSKVELIRFCKEREQTVHDSPSCEWEADGVAVHVLYLIDVFP